MADIKDNLTKLCDGDQTQIRATVAQRGAKGAQTVELVDASGNQITSFVDKTGLATEAKQDATITAIENITVTIPPVTVDPTGLATEVKQDDIIANQTDASQKTQVVDGAGNVVGATGNALDVNIKSGSSSGEQYADGTAVDAGYKGTIVAGTDGSNYQFIKTDADGNVQVDVLTMPSTTVTATNLDIRDLTSATDSVEVKQATATNLKAQAEVYQGGNAVAVGNPLEVKLPAATVTTLTPPAAITGFATAAKQLADGHSVALSATDNAVLDAIALGYGTEGDALGDGVLMQGDDGTDRTNVLVDAAGHLQVDVLSGGGAGEQYADNTVVDAGYKGNLILGTDGSNYQIISTNATGHINIADGGNTITVDGTVAVTNADLTTIAAGVVGTHFQCDVISLVDTAASDLAHIHANSDTIVTSLGNLDNSVDGNYLNVNCNIAGTDMVGGAGAVAAGVQRVTLASDDPAVAALGAISGAAVITDANGTIQQYLRGLVTLSLVDNVVLDNMLTALQAIDNSVDGNYQNVNLNIAGVDCDGNSGNKSAQTLRVVLATDQPQLTNKLLVTEDNSGSIKTAVETIDNAISGAGFNITQFAGAAVPIGAGVEATALRVTIATDSTGVLSVDDNGGALTVDGTVTANLSATDNTVLDSIQTAVEVIDNCISGSEAQVDVVAALPAGSNNIGDVDIASIASGSINGPAAPVVDSYVHAAINLAAGANQVLASSSANHQIWVYGFGIVCSAAGTVSFQDEDDTAVSGIMPFAANSGMAVPPSGNFAMPIWKLATDKDLEVDIVTAEVDGWIDYAIVNA